ncbi:hypothetical protein Z517_10386 [Fonsecaea pedrosoi CBS 271.37]|uniref:tRNA(Phe) 7-[(3-amino-3-carboxypropyl)-4-demethylwyosine(37)-N(4)]-methyltransferase n=1 Tax=Fonsecaea pedrosoi CBS 271.37 TaxID=1442368 RepID=A0A0D2GT86_9EURO|nr:uncharacterized protein Z517_10386 [Fonsecaea pedrosoi CBS 271.37]KIW75644.1 hypothetical protein Z517_10386 [Fonsecaea pedrosoi CBS 271.37]
MPHGDSGGGGGGDVAGTPSAAQHPSVPATFAAKKSRILADLDQPEGAYSDNSPKGTVDAQIRDLIDEINRYEGLVTTSSCAGRVAVFVEGPRVKGRGDDRQDGGHDEDEVETLAVQDGQRGGGREAAREEGGGGVGESLSVEVSGKVGREKTTTTTTSTSPGGKGGGRWLYVSHDPIPIPVPPIRIANATATATATATIPADVVQSTDEAANPAANEPKQEYFSNLFHLGSPSRSPPSSFPASSPPLVSRPSPSLTLSLLSPPDQPPQLIHLTFSPLILHVHCATLRHARHVLAAAVNSGFRESGVQSLRALDDAEHGVMVAVRTAGLAFETVVGVAVDAQTPRQETVTSPAGGEDPGGVGIDMAQPAGQTEAIMHRVVGEEYLALCAAVVNERFAWNVERRERFRRELKRTMGREGSSPDATRENKTQPEWEDKEQRRRRKRQEGLEKQRIKNEKDTTNSTTRYRNEVEVEELDQDLSILGLD